MAGFSAWVKKYLNSKSRAEENSRDQLPFLSTPRRPVTPTPFDTPTSPFFRLPYDIRTLILLNALGCRILHMDFMLQREGWRWGGAVCARTPFREHLTRHAHASLWNDDCLRSANRNVEFPPEYNPGVMGFLLACKQAYVEGIHILYSANRITISSEPLLTYLPRLLPTPRLEVITSLEIVVNAHYIAQPNGAAPSFSLSHLPLVLDNIKLHCPRLRSFCLAFLVASRSEEILEGPALSLVDAFHRSTRLREMRVELPMATYSKIRPNRMFHQHPHEAPTTGWRQRSLWRALDEAEPRVEDRSIERYPYPPLRLPRSEGGDEDVEGNGYWLLEGDCGPFHSVLCI